MADKDTLIQQFISVTQTDPERAQFYLESSGWNLEVAMSSFCESAYDEDGGNGGVEGAPEPQPDVPTDSSRNPDPGSFFALAYNEEGDFGGVEGMPESGADVSMPTDSSRNPDKGRVATFSSMSVDSESSDEEGQAYFAGGSDRSGQQILGPPKKKDANKLVDRLFKSARDHGAEEKKEETATSRPKRTFVGAGYRLGETSDDTTVVPGAPAQPSKQQVDKKLKLWKNGFSVDDGELRSYEDPANRQFLDSISKGEVPQELIREVRGGEVNLDMEDHRSEEFVKPKIKVKAFSGAGHMLGSPAPNVAGAASSSPVDKSSANSIQVDQSQPVTSVQLRLADGARLVLKMNHSHTIQDIRKHIISCNPQYAQANFCLMTTFPNKELTEETQTLEEAKLLNAVIVQRMK